MRWHRVSDAALIGARAGVPLWFDLSLVQIRRDVSSFLIDTHALPDLSVLQPGVEDVWLLKMIVCRIYRIALF